MKNFEEVGTRSSAISRPKATFEQVGDTICNTEPYERHWYWDQRAAELLDPATGEKTFTLNGVEYKFYAPDWDGYAKEIAALTLHLDDSSLNVYGDIRIDMDFYDAIRRAMEARIAPAVTAMIAGWSDEELTLRTHWIYMDRFPCESFCASIVDSMVVKASERVQNLDDRLEQLWEETVMVPRRKAAALKAAELKAAELKAAA